MHVSHCLHYEFIIPLFSGCNYSKSKSANNLWETDDDNVPEWHTWFRRVQRFPSDLIVLVSMHISCCARTRLASTGDGCIVEKTASSVMTYLGLIRFAIHRSAISASTYSIPSATCYTDRPMMLMMSGRIADVSVESSAGRIAPLLLPWPERSCWVIDLLYGLIEQVSRLLTLRRLQA